MTNAERQKRYRDKQRGGPPVGRWHGHVSAAKFVEAWGSTRTMLFMSQWIDKHAPDVGDRIAAGELKVKPTYDRLRNEYIMGVARAVKARKDARGVRLVSERKNGQFVFRWVPVE